MDEKILEGGYDEEESNRETVEQWMTENRRMQEDNNDS